MRQGWPGRWLQRRTPLVWAAAGLTLASGLFNLFVLVWPRFHGRTAHFLEYSPLEYRHLSRFLTMVLGFALSVTSINLFRRKRRAFYLVAALSAASVLVHLSKGRNLEHALVSLLVLLLLFFSRRYFVVGSGRPSWRSVLPGLPLGAALVLTYGVAGFWLLDRREFGLDFNILDSLHRTVRILSLVADPGISPQTRHARWFMDSLRLMSLTFLVYAGNVLYRPVLFRYRVGPRDLAQAREITRNHGRSALDYFKFWPDKSIFFSPSGRSFIAYGVSGSYAVALGDPLGPEEEAEEIIRRFLDFCRENDWGAGFHQTLPDLLPLYRKCGLKKIKIGDDAVVDLTAFHLDGKEKKSLRHTVNSFEKAGLRTRLLPAPLSTEDLARAREVSDAWLGIEGRRERGFTLGRFEEAYIRSTPLFVVEDGNGRMQAMANLIPSFAPGESTIDLMRHLPDAPNGVMDFLFMELFAQERDRGFTRFNLGMAPMSGFQEREEAGAEERAVHQFFQRLQFLFSYRGLRAYKAKFASSWEPRYAVYRNAADLPRLGLALSRLSSVKDEP